jgi:hypothetical protein
MYTAQISRANPTLIVFLIDQSFSMQERIGGGGGVAGKKKDVVADAINRLLQALTIKCAKEDGVRDYFHVAAIGYGLTVRPALIGPLADKGTVAISDIADNPARLEDRVKKVPDGAGGVVELAIKFPIWVDPVAMGETPMSRAMTLAGSILSAWLREYPDCYPPVVLNLTDGMSSDGDPAGPAKEIRDLASTDGNVLLYNLHVSADESPAISFPDSDDELPNDYAEALFAMSSVLPPDARSYAEGQGLCGPGEVRGFVFNADVTSIVQFLNIGTRLLAPR